MIYTIVIKKQYAQKGVHPSLLVVRNYLKLYGPNDLLICWPGYLSTNVTNANTFHRRFPMALRGRGKKQSSPCFFFTGRNGHRNINGSSTPITIAKYINDLYNSYSSTYCPSDDHSKIIAIIDIPSYKKPADGSSLDGLINDVVNDKVKVKALLIGSSNHSYYTMAKRPPDNKGECDVFMFDGDYSSGDDGAFNLYGRLMDGDKSERIDNEEQSILLTKEMCSSTTLNGIFLELLNKY